MKAATVPDLVLIEEAAQQSSYDKNHIRYLARKGLIQGKKIGSIWLINLDSLKEYESRMNAEGTQRHTPIRYKDSD